MTKSNKHSLFLSLREKFPVFAYKDCYVEHTPTTTRIVFHFETPGCFEFRPVWQINYGVHAKRKAEQAGMPTDTFIFHLGMVEMISYWKAFCSPEIFVKPFLLSAEQQYWWKNLFRRGLGEFFHVNGIPQPGDDLFQFRFSGQATSPAAPMLSYGQPDPGKVLVPVGGGKDSVVTLEFFKSLGYEIIPFVINPRRATTDVLETAGFSPEETVTMERKMEPMLLDLNKKDYLNGHTPFSAVIAFASAYVANQLKIKNIALSNESSANEPTIPGTGINHQYSKSFAFEKDFRQYTAVFLELNTEYFSLLRPLNEIQIAALFSTYTDYHPAFKSCNAGSKEDIWCGQCSKCLFTYIVLSPFIPGDQMITIFGKELFSDFALKGILEELCGISPEKPFECVGTIEEVNLALSLSVLKWRNANAGLPALLEYYAETGLFRENAGQELKRFLRTFDIDHFLPHDIELVLKDKLSDDRFGNPA
ncbi:MAG: hypothetical protein EA394_02085 [Bacteroidia bacterium]|nr:MAG: hypothetical protein EA394_02085 [Bacteroidia bacterium]